MFARHTGYNKRRRRRGDFTKYWYFLLLLENYKCRFATTLKCGGPVAAKSGPEAGAQFARTQILLIGLKVVPCAQRSDAWFVGVSFIGGEHQLRWAQIVECSGLHYYIFFEI